MHQLFISELCAAISILEISGHLNSVNKRLRESEEVTRSYLSFQPRSWSSLKYNSNEPCSNMSVH